MKKIFERLKLKWGITSNYDFVMINIVFSLAGMLIVYERKPLFDLLGITAQTPFWIKVLVYIPLVIPLYQINLLTFGFLLGQFPFFLKKEKQILKFFGGLFSKKTRTASSK